MKIIEFELEGRESESVEENEPKEEDPQVLSFFLTETEMRNILTGCAQPFITAEGRDIMPVDQNCCTTGMS